MGTTKSFSIYSEAAGDSVAFGQRGREFLKEHGQLQQLKATVAQQQEEFRAKIAQQQKQIEALTATVQKVSDQIALSKPALQLVANPLK